MRKRSSGSRSRSVRRALKHPVGTAVSTVFVLRAALRVLWYEPRTDLPELVARLKDAPPSRVGFDVTLADGIVERLLPLLPPWGAGRCVKRSLLQLDLWSRASRTPRLHLGACSRPGMAVRGTCGSRPTGRSPRASPRPGPPNRLPELPANVVVSLQEPPSRKDSVYSCTQNT